MAGCTYRDAIWTVSMGAVDFAVGISGGGIVRM